MLHPYYAEGVGFEAVQKMWDTHKNVRLEHAFEAELIDSIYETLPTLPFTLTHQVADDFSYQYYKTIIDRQWDPFQPSATLWTWLNGEGLDWLEAITGLELAPPGPKTVSAALYTKGCYLEPHNDSGHHRNIAFVIGFTPHQWAVEHGGHLQFLDEDGVITERRAPGYNTFDFFDVSDNANCHEIPMLLQHVQRYSISGWFSMRTR